MGILTALTRLNWNYQTIAATSAIISYLVIILLVAIKARRHPATKVFILANLAVVSWITSFNVVSMIKDKDTALFFVKIFEMGSIFTGPLYYHLALKVFNLRVPRHYYIAYFLASIFLVFDFFTPYFIKGLVHRYWYSYWFVDPGPLYYMLPFFFSYFVFNCCWKPYLYSKKHPQWRNQAVYFIIGIITASTGGLCYFLSIFGFLIPFAHDYLTILLPIATTYNIIRYRLMEIDTVIHRTFLWLVTLLILIMPVGLFGILFRKWIMDLANFDLLILISTILVFFVWYYSKLKPYVDHIFRRRKYDYYKILAEIGQKVGTELEIGNIVSRIFNELREVIYIRNGLILIREPKGREYIRGGNFGYEESQLNKQSQAFSCDSPLAQWLDKHQRVLERERIESEQEYAPMRQEALEFFNRYSLEVLIPTIINNTVNALIGIGKKENLQNYTNMDLKLLEHMGRQIGITIDNALHHEDIVEKERLAEELKLGREIQQNLLPKTIPVIEGLKLEGLMLPAKEIGGDYYDYIQTTHQAGEKRLGIVIGDVSGKGVAAGLIMATAKATLKGLSQQELTPKQILSQANNVIFEYTGGQKFMTLLYFQYKEKDKALRYSSAGHEHILIYYLATTEVESIMSGGFMLGMITNIETFLEEKQLSFNPKDKILLYTDGVTEAENSAGDRFGLPRLKEVFQKYGSKPANELIRAIKEEVYAFIGNQPQYDDITLVVMEAT